MGTEVKTSPKAFAAYFVAISCVVALLFLFGGPNLDTPVNATVTEVKDGRMRLTFEDGRADLVTFRGWSWLGFKQGDKVSLVCNLETSRCKDALLGWYRHHEAVPEKAK